MNNLNDSKNNFSPESQGEDINISKIFKTIVRNKVLIASLTLASTFSVYISSFIRKPIWEGSFQIVVEPRSKSDFLSKSDIANNLAANLIGGESSTLRNEVTILKSPSVLLSVYKEVKKLREEKGFEIKNMSYGKWIKDNLNISLVKGTNVLNLFYIDYDKEIIFQTLNSISSKYQEYSKSDRQRNINQGINYLENQIVLKRAKSINSLKVLNEFSIENGLGDLDGLIADTNINNSQNLDFLDNFDPTDLNIPINPKRDFSSDAGKRYQYHFRLLENYEAELADLSAKLKPNSKILKTLKSKVDNLKNYLKRPNEILIEYRTLKRIAEQDEQILSDLEDQMGMLKLEQAKIDNPWQLISNPEVYGSQKYPNKKKELIIAFIFSLFVGCGIALIREKLSGIFYEFEDIIENIRYPFIGKVYSNISTYNKQFLKKVIEEKVKSENKQIGLLDVSSIFTDENNDSNFIESLDNRFIKISDLDRNNIEKYNHIFLLIKPGILNIEKIKFLEDFLKFYEAKIIGWIYLDYSEKIPIRVSKSYKDEI